MMFQTMRLEEISLKGGKRDVWKQRLYNTIIFRGQTEEEKPTEGTEK